jgi:hypothetical protein
MNCFDCSVTGRRVTALGCCTNCGAGVCADHVELDAHELAHSTGPGIYTPHVTRAFTCTACAKIIRARRLVAADSVSPRSTAAPAGRLPAE